MFAKDRDSGKSRKKNNKRGTIFDPSKNGQSYLAKYLMEK
jgi:hypothetical protein